MLDAEALNTCLRESVGLRELQLLAHRPDTAVFSARRSGDLIIAKCSETVRRTLQEAEVLRLMEPSRVLVPRVLEVVETVLARPPAEPRPLGVLVISLLPGERMDLVLPALESAAAIEIWRQTGHALGLVQHSIDETELRSATFWRRHLHEENGAFSWRRTSIKRVNGWIATARRSAGDGDRELLAAMQWLADAVQRELREPARPTLMHCDYSPRNVLVDAASNRVTGVIDFETATLGDPQYDLAKSTWLSIGRDSDGEQWRRAFISGWEEASSLRFDPGSHRLYEAMQGLGAIAWAAGAAAHRTYAKQGARALLEAYRVEST
jgi:aminoglycoside phosphotransferase (APT) family kinase protein